MVGMIFGYSSLRGRFDRFAKKTFCFELEAGNFGAGALLLGAVIQDTLLIFI